MLLALTTDQKLGLAGTAVVFIAFSLLVALVIPRRNPDFPGRRGLVPFILVTLILTIAMLGAVEVFAKEEHHAAAEPGETTPEPEPEPSPRRSRPRRRPRPSSPQGRPRRGRPSSRCPAAGAVIPLPPRAPPERPVPPRRGSRRQGRGVRRAVDRPAQCGDRRGLQRRRDAADLRRAALAQASRRPGRVSHVR